MPIANLPTSNGFNNRPCKRGNCTCVTIAIAANRGPTFCGVSTGANGTIGNLAMGTSTVAAMNGVRCLSGWVLI